MIRGVLALALGALCLVGCSKDDASRNKGVGPINIRDDVQRKLHEVTRGVDETGAHTFHKDGVVVITIELKNVTDREHGEVNPSHIFYCALRSITFREAGSNEPVLVWPESETPDEAIRIQHCIDP